MRIRTGTTLRELVEAAVQAPSSHNTQPWQFSCSDDRIELRADRTRALPVNDPAGRELTISCGAALSNLRVAAAAAGLAAAVELLPAGSDRELLATVVLRPDGSDDRGALAGAIPLRRTLRGAFGDGRVPEDLVPRLDAVAAAEGVELRWVAPGAARDRVAELVAAGDRVQFADPAWRRELASWMRPPRTGDGLTVPRLTGAATRFAVTRFDLGASTARKDAALTRAAPLLGVLATAEDGPDDWLRTGQALQHVLLVAAGDGVQAGYVNQPCQVAELRPALREALALAGQPQIAVRLGIPGRAPSPSPRRPVDDVIDVVPARAGGPEPGA